MAIIAPLVLRVDIPSYGQVRKIIEGVEYYQLRMFLKTQYLLGAYISELAGKVYPSESKLHQELGPIGKDAWEETFYGKTEIPVFCFKIKTLRKRWNEDEYRTIALPKEIDDPWVEEVFNYFEKADKNHVFPYERQNIGYTIKSKIFSNLKYEGKPFGNNHLRYVRKKELKDRYGFGNEDLEAYGLIKIHLTRIHDSEDLPLNNKRWETYIMKLYPKRQVKDEKKISLIQGDGDKSKSNWVWGIGTYMLHFVKDGRNQSLCMKIKEFDRLQPYQPEPNDSLKCKVCLGLLDRKEKEPVRKDNENLTLDRYR
jgi:hypothetical protein